MDLQQILTDELIDMREQSRIDKDYTLSDQIRNELDSRLVFVFDHPEGQVIYHLLPEWFKGNPTTRDYVKQNIRSLDESFR